MATVSEFIQEIDNLNKSDLLVLHRNFLKKFINQHRELFFKLSLDVRMADENFPGRLRILNAVAAIFYHKVLFDALMNFLDEPVRHVYLSLIWEGKQRVDLLENRFSVKISSNRENIQNPQDAVQPEYLMLIVCARYYYDFHQGKYMYNDFELTLTPQVCNHLKNIAAPPEEAILLPFSELPPQDFIYENTDNFYSEFTAARIFLEQNKGERITVGVVNKVRNYFNLREFYPETIKPLAGLRTKLLLQFIGSCSQKESGPSEVHQQVKALFEAYQQGRYSNLQNLLFHLKGSKVKIDENTSVNSILAQTLAGLPPMQWISLPNLLTHIRYIKSEILPVKEYIARNILYIEEQGKFGKEPLKIRDDLYFPVITEPLIKSTFFLYAALGLVDIAYTLPRNEATATFGTSYFSVFDGLQYVRLTPLGAYVCDIDKSYQPPAEIGKRAECILDEKSLNITLSDEDKLKSLLLEKYAVRLSENSYKVDHESFLKDCKNKHQIVKKIETFRSEIMSNPPQIWKDFFKSIIARYNSIQQKKDFRIYKLPSGDKELLNLVAKDKILRNIVYKAENYHIMVNEMDMPLFQEKLKKFGYMWE